MAGIKLSKQMVIAGIGIVIGAACLSWLVARMVMTQAKLAQQSSRQTPAPVAAPPSIKLIAMGDMLAHDSVVAQANQENGYDFARYFTPLEPRLKGADVVFCNPETPVAGEQLGVSGYPTFNAPNDFARDLSHVGCNVINLATNHIYDKGPAGITESRAVWQQQNIMGLNGANSSPEQQREVSYFEKNGVKCAFVAFADFSNTKVPDGYSVNFYHDEALVRKLLTDARAKADVVIVSAHWGTEDATAVNDDQRKAAALFAGLGADVVLGTGPHVLQPVERIAGHDSHSTLVWYSLGNMLSSQLQANQLTGVVASMRFTKKDDAYRAEKIEATPTFMSYDWLAADKAAERLAARRNLQLRTLKDARDDITRMFPNETYESRRQFVSTTLGSLVTIKD